MRVFLCFILLMLASPLRADPMTAAAEPGTVLLMRHATAPGTGDPAAFRLGDCTTQRNLSPQGRAEAQAIGAGLQAAGLRFAHILASEWCRTTETAQLMGLGPVTAFPAANSFFSDRQDEPRQTRQVLDHLASLPADDRVLIVTHQVNITALTGIVPRSGEIVVARRQGRALQVLDRLPPP